MEILARGVGRRKEAVAQVQIVKGSGQFLINNIPAQQYLHNNTCAILSLKAPLSILNANASYHDNNVPLTEKLEEIVNSSNTDGGSFESNLQNKNGNPPLTLSDAHVQGNTENSNELPVKIQNNSNSFDSFDTIVKVKGGGLIGQAEAIKLGLARALCILPTELSHFSSEEIRKQLKDKGYLTQDSRVKERRKYGLKKARKATQYNKR
jgi:small subunit ribosomal protein S9